MFSRSEKAEETSNDEMFDAAEPANRTPLMLAGLAGLLAIVGAFLVFQYLGSQSDETAAVEAPVVPETEVLFANQAIAEGTDVSELLEAPATFLIQRTVPVEFTAPEAIASIEDLRAFDGLTLTTDLAAGEQLIASKFDDRSDFGLDGVLERNADVTVPVGHHTLVVPIAAERALGARFGPGELVSLLSSYQIILPTDEGDSQTITVSGVILPAVEVIAVETTAEAIGAIDPDADLLGVATVGDLYVTLALEPSELTQVVHSLDWGDLTIAGAVEGATPEDPRALSSIDSILTGSTLVGVEDVSELIANSTLGVIVDPEAGLNAVGTVVSTEADEDGADDEEAEDAPGS